MGIGADEVDADGLFQPFIDEGHVVVTGQFRLEHLAVENLAVAGLAVFL